MRAREREKIFQKVVYNDFLWDIMLIVDQNLKNKTGECCGILV